MPKIIIVIVTALIFLALAVIITLFVIIYQRRQLKFKKTTEELKLTFQQELLKSQVEMQEQTFNTISREIHDNVGQTLSLAKVQLNIIDQTETLDKTLLGDAKDGIGKAMVDLRDIARSLNTERIQLKSLPETVDNELKRISRAGLMLTSIRIEGKEQKMDDRKKLIIFRMIQESLQNIIKHSKAANIGAVFYYGDKELKIEIADDGKGFDMTGLNDKTTGLGLQNIISRASLIGGEASINSIINVGTTVTIKTPYA
jgi:signal transduction histidine kinase